MDSSFIKFTYYILVVYILFLGKIETANSSEELVRRYASLDTPIGLADKEGTPPLCAYPVAEPREKDVGKKIWNDFLATTNVSLLQKLSDSEIKSLLEEKIPDLKDRKKAAHAAWFMVEFSEVSVPARDAQYLRIAAIGGSIDAMDRWSYCLKNGCEGVEKNSELGNAWLKMAAKRGYEPAIAVMEETTETPVELKELFPEE